MRRVLLVSLLVCLSALLASAATFNGTLNAPANGGTSTLTWSGGPLTGSYVGNGVTLCSALSCDTYALTINVPATFYSSNPNYSVLVSINWGSTVEDLDLYVYDSGGNVVCSSTNGSTDQEFADCGQLPAGQYSVSVDAWIGANTTYSGTISLAPEPSVASGRARYKPGKFTFSTPQVLSRPQADAGLFLQQDAEPRVSHDALGNVYAAAIQGVPAGTDMWKSMDGGATWTYTGQPDGAQALAATAGVDGVGIGGGDEDFTIGSNGSLALSSLWLGAVTNCASSDGATTWLCNPLASDVPEDDRQWVAWYGASTVYLTTRNLGTLTFNTDSVYVVKSTDGGKTFGQYVEVTKPILGIRAGDEGNIIVDSRTGDVYLTFIGAGLDVNSVYVAKSTDGGQSFMIVRAYSGPQGVNLQHVFPSIAVDNGGGLHLVFNDGRVSYLTSSADGGATWTTPIRLNNSADSKTSLEPWVVAGDYGKVDVFFYGTPDSNFMSPSAQWKVFMAQTLNAFANVPLVTQSAATDIMHNGPICVNGTGCASGTRNLLEYFFPDVYTDGGAMAVYPDDLHVDPSTTVTRAWFIRQTGGSVVK